MTFIYRFIKWECKCGVSPDTVQVGVTSNGELIGVWTCRRCSVEVKALIPMEKLIADIPTPEPQHYTEDDYKLMKLARIDLGKDSVNE
jgi:hypothetical protein